MPRARAGGGGRAAGTLSPSHNDGAPAAAAGLGGAARVVAPVAVRAVPGAAAPRSRAQVAGPLSEEDARALAEHRSKRAGMFTPVPSRLFMPTRVRGGSRSSSRSASRSPSRSPPRVASRGSPHSPSQGSVRGSPRGPARNVALDAGSCAATISTAPDLQSGATGVPCASLPPAMAAGAADAISRGAAVSVAPGPPSSRAGAPHARPTPAAPAEGRVHVGGAGASGGGGAPRRSRHRQWTRASAMAGSVLAPAAAEGAGAAAAGSAPTRRPWVVPVGFPAVSVARTVLVVIAMSVSPPLFLVPDTPGLVLGLDASATAPRDSAGEHAGTLLGILSAAGLPLAGTPLLVSEGRRVASADEAGGVRRVMAAATARAPEHLDALACRAAGPPGGLSLLWLTLDDLAASEARYGLCVRALARMRTYAPSVDWSVHLRATQTDEGALERTGAAPLAAVAADPAHRSSLRGTAGVSFSQAWADTLADDEHLRRMILRLPHSDPVRAYADRVLPQNVEEVPPGFRGEGGLPRFDGADLRLLPFPTRVLPPRTPPMLRAPCAAQLPHAPGSEPCNLRDLYSAVGWRRRCEYLDGKLRPWLVELAAAVEGDEALVAAGYTQRPAEAQLQVDAVLARRPQPLVLGRSDFSEKALDRVHSTGGDPAAPPQLVPFGEPVQTHLDLTELTTVGVGNARRPDAQYWDQELFGFFKFGVFSKAELPFYSVFYPPLVSIAKLLGFSRCHKELRRLVSLGWFSRNLCEPYVPSIGHPNGTAARRLEPLRPRRTTDATASSRRQLLDSDGVRIPSLNLMAKYSAADVNRGTLEVYYARWRARLRATSTSPPPFHAAGCLGDARPPPRRERGVRTPTSPSARVPADAVEIGITATANRRLCNPFRMVHEGQRSLVLSYYREWLSLGGVCAEAMGFPGHLRRGTELLTGDEVERELQAIVDRSPAGCAFHLVCGGGCRGRDCHGDILRELLEMLLEGSEPRPFPKELKIAVDEKMTTICILRHVGDQCTPRIAVFMGTSDVKDFFNQLRTAWHERHRCNMTTLDLDHLFEASASLEHIGEDVLGYGYYHASEVAQRFGLRLEHLWYRDMDQAAAPIVAALRRRQPFIAGWLDDRARQLDGLHDFAASGRPLALRHARLWSFNMYTDDGWQVLLGAELFLCGLRVWLNLTKRVRLIMAIVEKFELGACVTTQGTRLHAGLGVAYWTADKLRRALAGVRQALRRDITVEDYGSLVGLLQSGLFLAGMRRSATFGMYTHAARGGQLEVDGPQALLRPTALMEQRLAHWEECLSTCAGAPLTVAVDAFLHGRGYAPPRGAPTVFYLRSDASGADAPLPGLGGHHGGSGWRYPDHAPLPPHLLQLPIACTEFAAYYGEWATFGDGIPDTAWVVSEVDALTVRLTLVHDHSGSPLMQVVLDELWLLPSFHRLAARNLVAHGFGLTNGPADAMSRGYFDVFFNFCRDFSLAPQILPAPPQLAPLMERLYRVLLLSEPSVRANPSRLPANLSSLQDLRAATSVEQHLHPGDPASLCDSASNLLRWLVVWLSRWLVRFGGWSASRAARPLRPSLDAPPCSPPPSPPPRAVIAELRPNICCATRN